MWLYQSSRHMIPYHLCTWDMQRTSGAPLHNLFRLYDVLIGFVYPLFWGGVLLYLRSPKGGCFSISDEDAYFSGHLVLSHSGLAFVLMLRPFFPEIVMSTDLLSFEHPSVLLFCLSCSCICPLCWDQPFLQNLSWFSRIYTLNIPCQVDVTWIPMFLLK